MSEPNAALPQRARHDAFDGKRRRALLAALAKSGCLRDAAAAAKVSRQTVYAHQANDPQFARQCELALAMASTDLELHAWERGVVGVEEPIVYHGEVVGTRVKRSDAILKLLLQGAKPKKYGRNPGFTRRRLHKLERERIEQDVRAELRVKRATPEEVTRILHEKLNALGERLAVKRRAAGWTQDGENWIPPGWVRIEPPSPPPGAEEDEQLPDSV